jgi:hypothetical protein
MTDPVYVQPSDMNDPGIQSRPPGDRPDHRAGLACHPGNLEPFTKLLVTPAAKVALESATKALTAVHESLSDMHRATDSLTPRPEDRTVVGPKNTVVYVIPEARKDAVREAMSISFGRGSTHLANAEKAIADSEAALQSTMDSRTVNTRRNETAVATIAAQIRDHLKNTLKGPSDRIEFVSKAIEEGDMEIVTAVLNASPFISGLDRQQMSMIRDQAERKFSPAEYKDREGLRAMSGKLGAAGTHYLQRLNELLPRPNLREAEGARAVQKLRTGA